MTDQLAAERSRLFRNAFRRNALHPLTFVGYVAATGVAIASGYWVVMAGGIGAILVLSWTMAASSAKDDWWGQLATHFGMRVGVPQLPPSTPLLRSGDERRVECLAEDGERQLAQYVTTDVSRDSKGRKRKTHHRYTVVVQHVQQGPQPIRFLSAHERKLMGLLDDRRGSIPGRVNDHNLESAALNKRFTVRISDEDLPRLGIVFEPAFMLWLSDHGRPFEYDGVTLVVYDDKHMTSTADYADLLDDAAQIHARIRDAIGNPLPREAVPPVDRGPSAGSVGPPV